MLSSECRTLIELCRADGRLRHADRSIGYQVANQRNRCRRAGRLRVPARDSTSGKWIASCAKPNWGRTRGRGNQEGIGVAEDLIRHRRSAVARLQRGAVFVLSNQQPSGYQVAKLLAYVWYAHRIFCRARAGRFVSHDGDLWLASVGRIAGMRNFTRFGPGRGDSSQRTGAGVAPFNRTIGPVRATHQADPGQCVVELGRRR